MSHPDPPRTPAIIGTRLHRYLIDVALVAAFVLMVAGIFFGIWPSSGALNALHRAAAAMAANDAASLRTVTVVGCTVAALGLVLIIGFRLLADRHTRVILGVLATWGATLLVGWVALNSVVIVSIALLLAMLTSLGAFGLRGERLGTSASSGQAHLAAPVTGGGEPDA